MAEANNTDQLRAALEQMIAAMPPKAEEAPQPEPEYGTARGVLASVNQGMTFGFSDEMVAGIRALVLREEGEDYSTAYKRHRDQVRGRLDEFREYAPWTAGIAEAAGALAVPGAATAGMSARFIGAGSKAATRLARAGAVGAAEGAIYGAGVADELSDVPRGAATGAAIGGAVGAAVPVAIGAAQATGRAVAGSVRPSFGSDFRLAQAMSRDGRSPEEISRRLLEARRLGRPATVADVSGKNVRMELEAAAQSPGAAAEFTETFLEKRNQEQLQRLSRDLARATGRAEAQDIYGVMEEAMRVRAQASEPVYKQAMQYQAEMNPAIVESYNRVIGTPLGKQALAKARRILNVSNFDDAPLMERVDALKKGIDDVADKSKRAGEKQISRRAVLMKQELLSEVDAANPTYRQAREIWEEPSRYIEAIESGGQLLQPKNTAALVRREWNALGDVDREAYRIGALDAIITRMRQQSAKEPNLLKIIRSPEIRDKLEVIMEPRSFQELEKILDIEEQMFETGAEVLRNSATARRVAVQEEQRKQMAFISAMGLILDFATAGLKPLVFRGIPYATDATRAALLSKQNQITARRLLSGTPTATNRMATTAAQVSPRATAAAIAPSVAATVGSGE